MSIRTKFSSNRRYPTVPTVTADPRSHTIALQALIEGVNIGQRRSGDVNDSFVRVGELVDMDLIELTGSTLKAKNWGAGIEEAPDDGNQYARQSGGWTLVSAGGGVGSESDPVFTAHVAYTITITDLAQWDLAYSWGNHASAGYLTTVVVGDVNAEASSVGYVLTSDGDGTASWQPVSPAGTIYLDDISDVSVYLPVDGYVLTWDQGSGLWIDAPPPTIPNKNLGAAWGSASALVAANCADVYVRAPCAGTITAARVLTQGGTGSCVIDVWKDTYANFPPTVADTITAAAKPTVSSGIKSEDTTLTGWTTSVSEGDILAFHVDSTSTFTNIVVYLTFVPA